MLHWLAGCRSYSRVDGPLPAAGTRLKVAYAQPQSIVIRFHGGDSVVRRGVTQISGTLRVANADSLHLSGLRPIYGLVVGGREVRESEFARATVTLPAAGAQLRAEKLAPVRTAFAIVLLAGAVVMVTFLIALDDAFGEQGGTY